MPRGSGRITNRRRGRLARIFRRRRLFDWRVAWAPLGRSDRRRGSLRGRWFLNRRRRSSSGCLIAVDFSIHDRMASFLLPRVTFVIGLDDSNSAAYCVLTQNPIPSGVSHAGSVRSTGVSPSTSSPPFEVHRVVDEKTNELGDPVVIHRDSQGPRVPSLERRSPIYKRLLERFPIFIRCYPHQMDDGVSVGENTRRQVV
jgi:hypothetical protein